MDYELVKSDLVLWAESEDNIRAILVTGSAARGQMDDLSDLDVELYVRNPAALLNESSWYERLGNVLVVEALPNQGWNPTRLVYYVGGKVDFTVVDSKFLSNSVHTRPFKLLVDKDGTATELVVTKKGETGPPSVAEFLEIVHWFWAEALMCAKAITRQELWTAMLRDWNANQSLLRMVEFDHKARYGWSYDTWWIGKHLSTWADRDVVDALTSCFAQLDLNHLTHALTNATELFQALATTTAIVIDAPVFDHARVLAEVNNILAKRTQ